MNGPGHYQEAEKLLVESARLLADPARAGSGPGDIAYHLVARAQVHATLAAGAASDRAAVATERAIEESRRLRAALAGQPVGGPR